MTDVSGCAVAPLVRAPLSAEAAATLAAQLKALADPVRLRLMSAVASHDGQEACVCDVSAGIDVSQPTISHHLKVLREAGVTSTLVVDGRKRGISLRRADLDARFPGLVDGLLAGVPVTA